MAPKWSPITRQCEFTKLLSTLTDSRIKCLLFIFQAVNQQTLHSEYGGWQWRRILHSKNWNFTGRLRQGNYHKFPVRLRHLARPHFKKPNKIIRWSRSEILVGKTGNLNTISIQKWVDASRGRSLRVKQARTGREQPGVFCGAYGHSHTLLVEVQFTTSLEAKLAHFLSFTQSSTGSRITCLYKPSGKSLKTVSAS